MKRQIIQLACAITFVFAAWLMPGAGTAQAAPVAASSVSQLVDSSSKVEKTWYYYRRHYWHRRHYYYHPYYRRHYYYYRPYYRRHYYHRYYW